VTRRARWGWLAVVAALAVSLGTAGWLTSPWRPARSVAAPTEPVVLAAGPDNGLAHRYGLALAAAPDAPGAVHVAITAGSPENLDWLSQGKATFALATADVVEAYLAATPRAQSIRAVARLYDSYLHLLVPTDSPVHRLADLAGRHVAVVAGAELVADRTLAAAGIDPATGITRVVTTPSEAVAALRAGRVDAVLLLDGVPSPDLATLPGRLVDLADVAGTLLGSSACPAAACAVYRAGTVPAASYRSLAVAVTTVAVPTLLLTTTRASHETVGEFTRLVLDSAPRIAATVPAVRQIDRHTAIFTGTVPLHEGAKAYYRATKTAI
jgi:hypothetical protein